MNRTRKAACGCLLTMIALGVIPSGQAVPILAQKLSNPEASQAISVYNSGVVALQRGRLDEAESAFLHAVKLEPNLIPPRLNLAAIYMNNLDRPQDAARLYEDVLAINPDDSETSYALGLAYARLGKFDKSIASLQKAAALSPGTRLPWQTLGDIYSSQQRTGEARTAYSQALAIVEKASRIPGASPGVFYDLGVLQAQLGNTVAARRAFDEALQRDPNHANAKRAKESLDE